MPPYSPPPAERETAAALAALFGVHVAPAAVCPGHAAPLEFLATWLYQRPSTSLLLGPRGGGKSYLTALATHLDSLHHRGHGTRVLGGSEAQSRQVYEALVDFDRARPGHMTYTKTHATYATGSDVSILAASTRSVRGPHVPTLRLDEIDEIDPEIREAAVGMCMAKHGVSASITMTSTWHKLGGPMAGLIDRAREGAFPFWTFCAFEVLETCPEERSGPNLENCPACPLVKWCHADMTGGLPKAKRSAGHYAIDSLIQKVQTVSLRVFEADYLCSGPKADGLWFPQFDQARHVSESAEYDPALPVHLAVDSGVFTGAVFYQVRVAPEGLPLVTVFADYLTEGVTAEANARAILDVAASRCHGRIDAGYTDPAGGARNPVGPTVIAEYDRAGLPLDRWPVRSVSDGLTAVESLLLSASGGVRLLIHPRCVALVNAFRAYGRAKRQGQWMDYPQDPQHPAEDLMDSLRGGIVADIDVRPAVAAGDPFGGARW